MIKTFTISAISFGLGAALTYFLVADGKQPESEKSAFLPSESIKSSGQQSTSVYTDYIRQLEELNRQLTNDLQAARGVQSASSNNNASDLPAIAQDGASLEEYYKARKNSEDFSQYLQTAGAASGIGYVKDLAAKFENEAVDSQWAVDYESRLYNLLESDALAGSVTAQSIVCKSRRCQIKVAISDIEQANKIMESFSQALNNNQLSIDKSMVVSAPDVSEGVVSLYVARDANVKIHE